MTKGLEHAWLYGQYEAFWQFNFRDDERENSKQAYEQVAAETWGWA